MRNEREKKEKRERTKSYRQRGKSLSANADKREGIREEIPGKSTQEAAREPD